MKIPRTYRLPEETDATIKRIAKQDDVSEADVIVNAVDVLSSAWQEEHNETSRIAGAPMGHLLDSSGPASLAKARENARNFLKKK